MIFLDCSREVIRRTVAQVLEDEGVSDPDELADAIADEIVALESAGHIPD